MRSILLSVCLLPLSLFSETFFSANIVEEATNNASSYRGEGGLGERQLLNFLALEVYYRDKAGLPRDTSIEAALFRELSVLRYPYYGKTYAPAWTDSCIANTILLISKLPSVWQELSNYEQTRFDWMMRMIALSASYHQHYDNNHEVSLDQITPFRKTMNSNIQQSPITEMMACIQYFGGISGFNQMMASFDFDVWAAADAAYDLGFINQMTGFYSTSQMKTLLEDGGTDAGGGQIVSVRSPFAYRHRLTKEKIVPTETKGAYDLISAVADSLYPHFVSDNWNTLNGEGYLVSGSSPRLGEFGMLQELGSAGRASISYGYHAWFNDVLARATMEALENWVEDSEMEKIMWVGASDLIYKISQGYHSIPSGIVSSEFNGKFQDHGYLFVKEVWERLFQEDFDTKHVRESLRFEIETLNYMADQNIDVRVVSNDASAQGGVIGDGISDGQYIQLRELNETNKGVDFIVTLESDMEMEVRVFGKRFADAPVLQLIVNGVPSPHYWSLDLNDLPISSPHQTFGLFRLTAGTNIFRLQKVGGSDLGTTAMIDFIQLVSPAIDSVEVSTIKLKDTVYGEASDYESKGDGEIKATSRPFIYVGPQNESTGAPLSGGQRNMIFSVDRRGITVDVFSAAIKLSLEGTNGEVNDFNVDVFYTGKGNDPVPPYSFSSTDQNDSSGTKLYNDIVTPLTQPGMISALNSPTLVNLINQSKEADYLYFRLSHDSPGNRSGAYVFSSGNSLSPLQRPSLSIVYEISQSDIPQVMPISMVAGADLRIEWSRPALSGWQLQETTSLTSNWEASLRPMKSDATLDYVEIFDISEPLFFRMTWIGNESH